MAGREQNLKESLMNRDFIQAIRENVTPFLRMKTFYRCALMEVETKFRVLNEEFSLEYDRNPIENIKTRIKSEESLARKLVSKNLAFDVEAIEKNIFDVAGIRVICAFKEDIYLLANCLLAQDDITLIERKDYIANPKESGYRSLHLIIEIPIFLQNEKRAMKVEVQLRTIAMDFWASLEHKLRYKKDIDPAEAARIAQELLQCSNASNALDDKMGEIKNQIEHKTEQKKDAIAYCGLDCEKCDAYRATVNNDDALREATAKAWSQMNQAPITAEMINCLGCRGEGIKTPFCEQWCEIRPCAQKKQLATCGACAEKESCAKLAAMASNSPEILENL